MSKNKHEEKKGHFYVTHPTELSFLQYLREKGVYKRKEDDKFYFSNMMQDAYEDLTKTDPIGLKEDPKKKIAYPNWVECDVVPVDLETIVDFGLFSGDKEKWEFSEENAKDIDIHEFFKGVWNEKSKKKVKSGITLMRIISMCCNAFFLSDTYQLPDRKVFIPVDNVNYEELKQTMFTLKNSKRYFEVNMANTLAIIFKIYGEVRMTWLKNNDDYI